MKRVRVVYILTYTYVIPLPTKLCGWCDLYLLLLQLKPVLTYLPMMPPSIAHPTAYFKAV